MNNVGHLHPISQSVRKIITIFNELGFAVADGPEIETGFYNFDVLNIPQDHPARDMQDTFWLKQSSADIVSAQADSRSKTDLGYGKNSNLLLRTHTTSVSLGRYLEQNKDVLPVRVIVPGKVFRNEATDATHEVQFYQIDGAYVDKEVSLADLKGTLTYFFKELLGSEVNLRFRPSYFSFVEPGVEIDIKYRGKWLEVMGAGMIHPNVFKAVGVDSSVWRGFAFGCGIDRLIMINMEIPDIRMLYSGDLRLINQF